MSRQFDSFCIVADDLSGAADCAAAFARMAGPVPVLLGPVTEPADRLAIDTDSRSMDCAAAVAATTRAFEQIARSGLAHGLVYKKIDSTLRGHVGAELEAALRAGPQFAGAIVAPAFPEQGRTLAGGRLCVQGQIVDRCGHSGDLMSMLAAVGLQPVLLSLQDDAAQLAPRIAHALQGGARAIVVDAADQGDLTRLAAALCSGEVPRVLVAGSAGLARTLATHFDASGTQTGHEVSGHGPAAAPRAGAVIVVVGSFSSASAAQVQRVEESGDAQVIRLDSAQWLEERHSALRRNTVEHARESLRSGGNLLIAIGGEVAQPFSRSLVRAMAQVTAPLLQHAAACVLTGGDTARAMFNELGIDRLDVCGEFEPGISMASAAPDALPAFVLKAGGFGDAPALQRIIRHFGHERRQPAGRQPAPS